MRKRTFRSFKKSEKGTSALEFAMLAPIMIAVIISALEAGLIATRITLLDSAMMRTARMIYTGAVADGDIDKDGIEDFICEQLQPFAPDCEGNLNVEVTPILDFDQIPEDDAECRDTSVEIEPSVVFDAGGATTTMYMRACLTMDIIVPGLGVGLSLAKSDSGRYQTVSAIAFQNEPF